MTSRRRAILLVAGCLILVVIFAVSGVTASPPQQDPEFVFVVTTTEDHNDGFCNADCSLRDAIIAANQLDYHATILLPSGTYTLTLEGPGEDDGLTGDLDIRHGLTIIGDGHETTIIDAGGLTGGPDRVFDIHSTTVGAYNVDFSSLTITGGHAGAEEGGGIKNTQVGLVLHNSSVTANSAQSGGGIYTIDGQVQLVDSTISENSATDGGGIFMVYGYLNVDNSTISGNSAAKGGGILNRGSLYVENGTISGNSATAGNGGGILASADGASLHNTIVANNAPGNDCAGTIKSNGHNLDSDGTCSLTATGDLPGTDPRLGPLQDNGGPTLTHALLFGSPAMDAGDDSDCPATDQRGFIRPMDGDGDGTATCDIGAFQHLGLAARTIYPRPTALPITIP